MSRIAIVTVILAVTCIFAACTNPADNKPVATVDQAATPITRPASSAAAEKLAITPETSKVEFIGCKVTDCHNCYFKKFTGTIELLEGKAEASQVSVEIDMSSVVTDADLLTEHLQEEDFFFVSKYPTSKFTSVVVKPGGEKGATHTVTGNLDFRGVTKTITFPATIQVTDNNVTVKSEFVINRKDFGIVYQSRADNLIKDEVVMKLDLNVPRKKA